MKKGDPIIVERVANGYSIRKNDAGDAVQDDDLFVFQTFQAMIEWLATEHFMEAEVEV